jgi:hypothetical protein
MIRARVRLGLYTSGSNFKLLGDLGAYLVKSGFGLIMFLQNKLKSQNRDVAQKPRPWQGLGFWFI